MIEVNLDKKDYLKLKKSPSLVSSKHVYKVNDDFYKIYTFDSNNPLSFFDRVNEIDREQIIQLSNMQKYISLSHLPKGIISYKNEDIGVIYDYFEGYKSFLELYKEDKDLMFDNLKRAIDAANELINHEIYNSDLVAQNILYKGNNVELIDLDGPYVGSSISKLKNMYRYFLECILNILYKKLQTQYTREDCLKLLVEIKKILNIDKTYIDSISVKQIEKIESLKLIK